MIILDLCFKKTPPDKLQDYRDIIVFETLRFQNVFHPHEHEKAAFQDSSGCKLERFRTKCSFSRRFRDVVDDSPRP